MYKNRYLRVFSRHPSHDAIRSKILLPTLAAIRFGSSTLLSDKYKVVLNSVQAIKNSSNKLLMKQKFTEAGVKTADWWTVETLGGGYLFSNNMDMVNLPYPIVAKHIYGSRGRGNTKLNTQEELVDWMRGKTLGNYIFERFYNYSREYRLHVTEEGCFYTCRKMLKENTPEDQRWFRNDSNSVWMLEENPNFDKPVNWDEVVEHSVRALKAVGLDMGAVDLRIQSSKHPNGDLRDYCDFIVLEINSAPSFGDITAVKYAEEIPKLINKKLNI
jgi:glutathione synthase/RimK-type ligase-like ATP-grasp enzyme